MDSLNVKNINDEKIFNVIDPNGQGEVVNRIRPISISINQKAETINNETDSKINLSVYWNDTWKSILDLTFNDSLRQEYGKLVTDLTTIQKDIDMKQYKDAETKTSDFLKYVANLSSKYTNIPETQNVAASKNEFIEITAQKNSFVAKVSDNLLNFMLRKFAKVANMDYTKANECFSVKGNDIDLYFHSPELFAKQAYMTVVKDNKVIGSYKATYDQFSKLASKLTLTPQQLGYSKDKMAGYIKTAEVVMQNIFFDSVDEAKEWQEMVDEKKKEQADVPEGEETETTETTETETKTTMEEGKSESPVKGDGGLARPSEEFAGADELPESEPRQQEQQGGQMAASRRLNLLKKKALRKKAEEKLYTYDELSEEAKSKVQNAIFESTSPYMEQESIDKYNIEQVVENFFDKNPDLKKDYYVQAEDLEINYHDHYNSVYARVSLKNGKVNPNFEGAIMPIIRNVLESFKDKLGNEDIKELEETAYYDLYWEGSFMHYQGFVDLGSVEGYEINDAINQALDEKILPKVEKVLEDIADEITDYVNKEHDYYYSEEFVKEECEQRELRFDEEGNMVKEGKKRKSLNKNAKNKILTNKRKANLKKQAIEGDVQEQDIVPAKIETKVYLQSDKKDLDKVWGIKMFVDNMDSKDGMDIVEFTKIGLIDHINGLIEENDNNDEKLDYNCSDELLKEQVKNYLDGTVEFIKEAKATPKIKKSAGKYKAKVAEILDEINDPDVLVDYISESDAEEICEKCEIPHEASWYKGDLRGHIAEVPDGMVDVLIEYISESDAEHIWRQIQHDMGNEASKKTNVQKKAEETVEEKMEKQVGEDGDVKGVIGVGDIVCIKFYNLSEGDFAKYSEFLGMPMFLIENDKEDISKVIIEQVEYPFQRVTINKDNIGLFDNIKEEQVLVEDVDGDEMITDFVELPVVAKQCKIKSIHKAARLGGK